ncbi:hypothetical protein K438DRAFT_1514282, partial [Mycena galopus ATCC 62051]
VKEKWVSELHHHYPNAPFIIVGTKIDSRDDSLVAEKLTRQIQRLEGERLARDLGALKYIECSALARKGLKEVFDEVRR